MKYNFKPPYSSHQRGLNFFHWIQILIQTYFPPSRKISLALGMQFEKERALPAVNWIVWKCLSARSEEADLNDSIKDRGKPHPQEVHFTLNLFLCLALPLPHLVSLFPVLPSIASFSLFVPFLPLFLFSDGESQGTVLLH